MSEPAFPPLQRLASPFQIALTFVGMFLVALLVMMVGMTADISGDERLMLATSLATLLVCLSPLVLMRAAPVERRHILLALWSAGMGVYFAMPIFTQYFFLPGPVDGMVRIKNIDPQDILTGQYTVLLALLCTYVGYFYPLSGLLARAVPQQRVDWSHSSALTVALVLIPAGWVVMVGGQFGLIPSRLGSGAIGSIAITAYLAFGLLAVLLVKYRSRPAWMLMMVLIVPTMLFGFLTGSKRAFLSPVMATALGYFVATRRVQARWIVFGLVALVLLYPLASFYRSFVLLGHSIGLADVITNPGRILTLMSAFLGNVDWQEYLETGVSASSSRLDALGILTVIIRDTPDRVPFQGGWTIGYVFISFIPRLIWPGKPPIGIGQWVTDNYVSEGGLIASQTGCTWIGEFYMNFGMMGVVVGMLVIGMYFRLLHETLIRSMTVPAMFATIVILWATCTTIEMALIAPFNGTIFTLGPVLAAHLAVRTMARQPRAVGAPASPVLGGLSAAGPAAGRDTS